MKNTIKISRLMDAYTDNEFFIQGESEVNMDTVKNNVIEKAEGTKKRMKPVAKVLIGVAAAAALAVGATAATIAIMQGSVTNASGATYNYEITDGGYSISMSITDYGSILTLEDGRLYFNINDESTDVTDLMDNQTPYIYAYTNTDTGMKNYVVLGGTPEEYYIIDLTYIEGIGWWGDGALDGIGGNIVQFRLSDYEGETPEENYTHMSLVFGKSFIKDRESGEVTPVEGGWPYHDHHISWEDGVMYYTDLPENWETDCMDAWLLKALIQLEIIPAL